MVLYICEKFHNNISKGFQLTGGWGRGGGGRGPQVHGRNGYVQCSKDKNSKSRKTRVTIPAGCLIVLYICVKSL